MINSNGTTITAEIPINTTSNVPITDSSNQPIIFNSNIQSKAKTALKNKCIIAAFTSISLVAVTVTKSFNK